MGWPASCSTITTVATATRSHEHVVLSNRVRRSSDKVWTALDGRKIYASLVEISEVHENLLQDLLTERFGWSWTLRQDTGTKAVVNEVEGVPQELIDAFSGRHAEIAKLVEEKIKEEERQTGKEVGPKRRSNENRSRSVEEHAQSQTGSPTIPASQTRTLVPQARRSRTGYPTRPDDEGRELA